MSPRMELTVKYGVPALAGLQVLASRRKES